MNELSLDIIEFCAIECELQVSGEHSVAWMCNAWAYALDRSGSTPRVSDIIVLGKQIEPHKNLKGFRDQAVWVGSNEKAPWPQVPELTAQLVEQTPSYVGDEGGWFKKYEDIHPFVDGNGRSGVILFNWLCGSLLDPKWAPNFWNDRRRKPGYGA